MKIFVMSDIHLGDTDSLFGNEETLEQNMRQAFACPSGPFPQCDILILNGDILDFAITAFEDTFSIAQKFFQFIYDEHIAKMVLYIPGNHDRQVWDALQWERCVMSPIYQHKPLKPIENISPVFIDFRENGVIHFPGKTSEHATITFPAALTDDSLGNVFLQNLVNVHDSSFPFKILVATPVVFINLNANPSAPLQTDDLLMIAHGQHLQTAWMLITDLLNGFHMEANIPLNLRKLDFNNYSLSQLEQYNYFITSMIGTDCGQTGEVAQIVQMVERAERTANDRDRTNLYKALNKIGMYVIKKLPQTLGEIGRYIIINAIIKIALDFIKNCMKFGKKKIDCQNKNYAYSIKNIASYNSHFQFFMNACCKEWQNIIASIESMQTMPPLPAVPGRIILGHSHLPIIDVANSFVTFNNVHIKLYNTGGWLSDDQSTGIVFQIDSNPAPGKDSITWLFEKEAEHAH